VFVRVVHRQGWDVERVAPGRDVEKRTLATREAALEFARGLSPDWIEVGEVVPATGAVEQHHEWTTLRRQPDGSYAPSGLRWGGKG